MRRGGKRALIFILIGSLLAGLPVAESAEKLKFSINWIPYGLHGGFFGALGEGFYREAGLDLEWERGYGNPDTVKRVAVGQVPLVISDITNVALGRARGLEVKSIAQLLTLSPHAIFTFKDSGIQEPKDLTGRTVSTAAGAIVDQTFPVFAESLGIKVGQWIKVEPAGMNATLLSGKSHALLAFGLFHPILNREAAKLGKEVRVIWWSDYGFEMLGDSLVTTDKLIRENPDLVRRFVRATLKGYAWSIEHPAEAARHLVKVHPTANAEIEEQQWKLTIGRVLAPGVREKGLGPHDFKKVEVTRDLIFKVNGIQEKVPAEAIATNDLLPPERVLPKR
jgi:NitT/TauT family transport system substrate-binding protein